MVLEARNVANNIKKYTEENMAEAYEKYCRVKETCGKLRE